VRTLVALDTAPGPPWLDAVRRIWDDGDAVAPLDPLDPPARRSLVLAELAPGAIDDGHGSRVVLPTGRPVETGDALVMATSGTTANPKGVVLTHESLDWAARASAEALGAGADDVWLACLPLHHIGGFSVVTRAWTSGSGLVVHDGFEAAAVEAAARSGATHTSLVTTALRRIDPSLFTTILLGGSSIPRRRPANTVATYGMTESGAGVVYDGVPLPGVEVRIGEDDAILLRSPTLLRCYRDGTIPIDREGWYRTGDLGALHSGRLVVHGRADDVIVTGGEKVWPESVEAALRELPGIADLAVVGRPDPEWGQRVTAVVVPSPGQDPPELAVLRATVAASLPRFCAPRAMEIAEVLPRTSLGKLRRREI